MDSHLVAWASLHGQDVAVAMPVSDEPAVGQPVGLRIDASRASLFDAQMQRHPLKHAGEPPWQAWALTAEAQSGSGLLSRRPRGECAEPPTPSLTTCPGWG